MERRVATISIASIALVCSSGSWASPDFGYVYTAGVEEPAETEVELWATDRRGKREGHYDAQDYRVELEHGFSKRFQVSAYMNLASHHIHGVDGEHGPVHRNFGFQGLSGEFKYQLFNPQGDRIGLALYVEPEWSRISKVRGDKAREFELELKAILQRNFFADRLVWAANVTFEPEWEREHALNAPGIAERKTEKEMAIELSSGLSYQVATCFWLGIESRYHSVYPDWTHGLHRENYAVYAGPSVHYSAREWGITATWLPQLFGGSNRAASSLEFDDHEKREFRLKVSRDF